MVSDAVNDTYYSSGTYNTPEWRNPVMCQEVGYTLGLDHQDVNQTNDNLGSCMDYTNKPVGPLDNQHPNQHDYDQLVAIYGHTDLNTTVATTTASSLGASGEAGANAADGAWGTLVKVTNHGRGAWYLRDLRAGNVIMTHVFSAN